MYDQDNNNYGNNDFNERENKETPRSENEPSSRDKSSEQSGYYNEYGEYISRPTSHNQQSTYNYDNGGYYYGGGPGQQRNQNPNYRWDYNNYETYNRPPEKKKSKGLIAFVVALVAFLLVGVVAISVVGIVNYDATTTEQQAASSAEQSSDGGEKVQIPTATKTPDDGEKPLPETGELMTISQVAKKVTPSVVGILRYENTLYEATGLGSGFVLHVDDDGYAYIVTNAHVVEYGTNFKVRLYDGAEYNADLVGADQTSDIAVLRIKADESVEVIAATIGDSTQLEVGETVVAIGNPISFDLSGSVTQGIVSALDRQLHVGSSINYIQTDAAINPGNSGGALVNLYGQVIGINTMKVQATGYEGIGFAIPMSEALPIIEDLIENGRVTSRPMLGITGVEIGDVESIRLEAPIGIMVYEISEQAQFDPEIKVEDIITHVAGERITGLSDLKEQLNKHKVGDVVELTVHRKIDTVNSEEIQIKATLIASEA